MTIIVTTTTGNEVELVAIINSDRVVEINLQKKMKMITIEFPKKGRKFSSTQRKRFL